MRALYSQASAAESSLYDCAFVAVSVISFYYEIVFCHLIPNGIKQLIASILITQSFTKTPRFTIKQHGPVWPGFISKKSLFELLRPDNQLLANNVAYYAPSAAFS